MPTILLSKIYPKGSALKNLRVGSTDVKYVKRGDGKLFYDTLKSTTYNKPSITLTYPTSNTSAAGGTTSPSSFSYSQSWYYTGHSGNTYSQSNKTSGATVSYSISGTGASINASTGVVTWASRGTTYSTSTREATVTVTVAMNGQTNTATAVVKQAKNDMTIIGGDTTYGNITKGSITNATIPASGGTKTATAGNGSQSYSTTRKYYLYDSGSEETISNATSGTISVAPSPASLSATASSKGTTVSDVTIVDYVTVEWSANGKSATDTMYVYQAANSKTQKISYGVPVITTFTYSQQGIYPCTYGDGNNYAKPSITISVTNTTQYEYTSGSTSGNTAVAGSYAGLTFTKVTSYNGITSASDATVDGTTGWVGFANSGGGTNNVNSRTCWVKATVYNASDSSKTASSTVAATQTVDSIATSYTWNPTTPTVTYASKNAAAGAGSAPTITNFKCVKKTYWGFAGTTISSTTITTPAAKSFYFTNYTSGTSGSYGTINASTGVITWQENTGTYGRSMTVYVTLRADTSGASGSYKQFTVTASQNAPFYWCRITLTSAPGNIAVEIGTTGLWQSQSSATSGTAFTSPPVIVTGDLPSSVGTSPALGGTTTIANITSGMVFTTSGYSNPSTGGVGGVGSYWSPSTSFMNPSLKMTPVSMITGTSGTCTPVNCYLDQDINGYVCFRGKNGVNYWASCKVRFVYK